MLPSLCGRHLETGRHTRRNRVFVHASIAAGNPSGQYSGRPPDAAAVAVSPQPKANTLFCRPQRQAETSVARTLFTVIVGNPPFSGISQQQGRWIVDLLRGQEGGRHDWCNYFEVDGQPLGERKTWLQDDYVKFLRHAHWKIELAGCGIVGFVTNHGYLDNPTFRGVRRQLLTTFPRITVIDLHGNRKKKERPPDGRRDENVFRNRARNRDRTLAATAGQRVRTAGCCTASCGGRRKGNCKRWRRRLRKILRLTPTRRSRCSPSFPSVRTISSRRERERRPASITPHRGCPT